MLLSSMPYQSLLPHAKVPSAVMLVAVMPRVVNAPVSRFHWLRPAASESLPVYMALA